MRNAQSQQRSYISPASEYTARSNAPMKKQERFSGWILLPLRLFLGITFVYAGIQKLTDPQFFHRSTPGYIGNQIIAFSHNTPLHTILIRIALPHAMLFGYLIAFGEIAIGLGTLVGLFFRGAAFCGLVLSLIFFLSASWHVYPYFYGADIVFVFAWLTLLLNGPLNTGLPAADTWLVETLFPVNTAVETDKLSTFARLLLIGSPRVAAIPARGIHEQPTKGYPAMRGGHTRAAINRKVQNRRSFILGALSGGAGVLSLSLLSLIMRSLGHGDDSAATTAPAPVPTTAGTTAPSTAGAAGGAIAQASSIPRNSATTFTIPSSGDPGVLIHLSNDQFVAYDATCTHAGCQVDYDSSNQQLTCPCHGATFDPAHDAAVLGGPAPSPLTKVAIHVDGTTGAITLQS